MAVLYKLEVYTPQRLFFSGSVEAISLTLTDGEAGIYANHAPMTAPVVPCILKILDKEGTWLRAFCAEGILEVSPDQCVLVTDAAEWPREIDRQRAEEAKERAEKALAESAFKFEAKNLAAALQRANMRLRACEEGSS